MGAAVPAHLRDHLRRRRTSCSRASSSSFIVAAKRHGISSGGIGACIALFGACCARSARSSRRSSTERSRCAAIVVLNLWLNVVIVAFVVVPNVYVLLAATVPVAFFIPAGNAAIIGYRTAVTPDRLIGRVEQRRAQHRARSRSRSGRSPRASCSARPRRASTVLFFTIVSATLALWGTLSPSIRKRAEPERARRADVSTTPLRRNRDFMLLQAGQLLSTFGSSISGIAYPLLVLAVTGSAAKAGYVGAAQFTPLLAVQPRRGRRRRPLRPAAPDDRGRCRRRRGGRERSPRSC